MYKLILTIIILTMSFDCYSQLNYEIELKDIHVQIYVDTKTNNNQDNVELTMTNNSDHIIYIPVESKFDETSFFSSENTTYLNIGIKHPTSGYPLHASHILLKELAPNQKLNSSYVLSNIEGITDIFAFSFDFLIGKKGVRTKGPKLFISLKNYVRNNETFFGKWSFDK